MKLWSKHFVAPGTGGPWSFARTLACWLNTQGVHTTGDFREPGITAALAVSTIESPELRRFKWRRIPIVQRIDGVPFNTPGCDFPHETARLRRCYEVADAVVFQSKFSRRAVTENFGPPGCEARIIYNGASLARFARPKPPMEKPLTLACSSVWRPQKRLGAAIQGFIEFHKTNPDSRLIVIGSTDAVARELIDHPAIEYQGAMDHDAVIQALASAHILLHLAWLDWCPNVVLEAQAMGLPVICTNSGGTREIVVTDSGLAIDCDAPGMPSTSTNIHDLGNVPPVPADRIAEAIERVVATLPARREKLTAQRDQLGIERAGGEYLTLFEDLCSGKFPRPRGRSFFALGLKALRRKIFPRKPGPWEDVLVLTTRKGFWNSPESGRFPNIFYTPILIGHGTDRINSTLLFLHALPRLLLSPPKIVIIGSAHRVAGWLVRLRRRGLFGRSRLIIHNMVYFWHDLAPSANRIVVYSSKEAALHAKAFSGSHPFIFIPLPADGDCDLAPRPSDEPYIFAGGSAKRDYATLIEAARGLPLRVHIRCNPEAMNYAAELPVNVTIGGPVPLPEFLREMADARFVAVPLQESELPHGHTTVAQALRLGKVVVTTQGASVSDYVSDGVEGLLVPPGDAAAWRDAVLSLWHDEKRLQAMEENVLKKGDLFTYAHYAAALEELCEEVLNE